MQYVHRTVFVDITLQDNRNYKRKHREKLQVVDRY